MNKGCVVLWDICIFACFKNMGFFLVWVYKKFSDNLLSFFLEFIF